MLITISQLLYRVKCVEDLHPCKERTKDMTLTCDGSAVKITDEDLERVGSKLENRTFSQLRIINTNVVNLRKYTFGKTVFRAIEFSNNTELESIHENAFKIHEYLLFMNLVFIHNLKLKTDGIFSLYKNLNPIFISIIDQNIEKLPENAFKIPEPKKNILETILLSNNKIKNIQKNLFIDCPKLRYIELNNNLIESIEDFSFDFKNSKSSYHEIKLIGNKLKTSSFTNNTFILNKMLDKTSFLLHLENNSLTDLPEMIFKPWFGGNDNFIYVNGNQFNCKCDMKWILHQPKTTGNHMQRFNGVFCQNKNKFIESLTDNDFDC